MAKEFPPPPLSPPAYEVGDNVITTYGLAKITSIKAVKDLTDEELLALGTTHEELLNDFADDGYIYYVHYDEYPSYVFDQQLQDVFETWVKTYLPEYKGVSKPIPVVRYIRNSIDENVNKLAPPHTYKLVYIQKDTFAFIDEIKSKATGGKRKVYKYKKSMKKSNKRRNKSRRYRK